MQVEKEKRKRKRIQKPAPYYVFFIVLAGMVVLVWITLFNTAPDTTPVSDPSEYEQYYTGEEAREIINERLAITLPTSIGRMVIYHRLNQGNYTAYIRFDIPPNTLTGMIHFSPKLCFDFPLRENFNPYENVFFLGEDWWQPDDAEVFAGGRCRGDYYFYNILVDQTNPEWWIVYIHISST